MGGIVNKNTLEKDIGELIGFGPSIVTIVTSIIFLTYLYILTNKNTSYQ